MKIVKNAAMVSIGPILFVGLYALYSQRSESFYFPTPVQIGKAFDTTWLHGGLREQLVPSLERLLIGYAVAIIIGVVGGLVIGLSRWAADATDPIVHFLRALPPPALIPIGIIILGIGDSMKIATIVLGAIWPILLNTIDGARAIEPTLLDVAGTYRIPARARIRHIVLPSASPQIFAGMRISLAIAIALMVISEMLASSNGVGYAILEAQRTFAIPEMWAGILLLGVVGYAATALFAFIERRVLRWHAGLRRLETSI